MLEKQAVSQPQVTNNSLLMQQQIEAVLTSGMPAPHLSSTPKNNGPLATSAPFAGSADVNVSELLAAAAAAAAAAANSAPMSAAMRPGALNMHQGAASAGMPHNMPPPGSLAGMHHHNHHRMGGGNSSGFHAGPPAHKHMGPHMGGPHSGGMLPSGPHQGGAIGAGRHQANNAQAAAAAAAIAAVAAQGIGPGSSPDAAAEAAAAAAGHVTDSQGNILPLSRLQEIWSR